MVGAQEGGRREQQTKERRRQILLEHGCRAERMREHAKEASRYETDESDMQTNRGELSAIRQVHWPGLPTGA